MVQKGSFVRVTYIGRIKETGELFDTTDRSVSEKEGAFNPKMNYGPVMIVVGEQRLIRGLDEALQEMNVGEERTLEIPPEKAFGQRSNDLVRLVPLQEFKRQGFVPQQGMPISMNDVRGRVLSVNSGRVRVDFNHPLAGKTLGYNVKIEAQVTDRAEQAQGICDFYAPKLDVRLVKDEVDVVHEQELPQRVKQAITDDIKKYMGITGVKFTQTMKPQDVTTEQKE